MSKTTLRNRHIITLAYMHRYVYPIAAVALPLMSGKEGILLAMGCAFILLAIYDLVGYKCRWKHICCSWQNAKRQAMTPHCISWHTGVKSYIYGSAATDGLFGVAVMVVHFLVR